MNRKYRDKSCYIWCENNLAANITSSYFPIIPINLFLSGQFIKHKKNKKKETAEFVIISIYLKSVSKFLNLNNCCNISNCFLQRHIIYIVYLVLIF